MMRIDLQGAAPSAYAAMTRFDAAASERLTPALAELVRVRASQLNGCTFCLGLHTRAALEAGEDEARLRTLALWRDSDLFTEAERAALALTETMTTIAETGVPDEAFEAAREHFDEGELAHLLWTIAAINAWNRVAIAAMPPAE
jgi:AhpD family alkylhydroperoxidase